MLVILLTIIVFITPLILLAWFGGHRYNLKRLTNGKPVLQRPGKHEHSIVLGRGGVIIPKCEPMRYLGATASAGTLRNWCYYYMIPFCVLVLGLGFLPGSRLWFLSTGYLCLLITVLYAGDISIVARHLKLRVGLFAIAHIPIGITLCISNFIHWRLIILCSGSILSCIIFLYTARIIVPSDDIIYEIKTWKKQRK